MVDLADPGNVLQIGIGRILILLESTRQNYQCRAINIDIVDLNGFKRLGGFMGNAYLSLVNFYDVRVHVIVILILIVIVLNFNDAMYQEIEIILV